MFKNLAVDTQNFRHLLLELGVAAFQMVAHLVWLDFEAVGAFSWFAPWLPPIALDPGDRYARLWGGSIRSLQSARSPPPQGGCSPPDGVVIPQHAAPPACRPSVGPDASRVK